MTEQVAITGMAVVSAYGRTVEELLSGVLSGKPAFSPVTRFDVGSRRVGVAATLAGSPDLAAELTRVIGVACDQAGLGGEQRAGAPLLLAVHNDPSFARASTSDRPDHLTGSFARSIATATGVGRPASGQLHGGHGAAVPDSPSRRYRSRGSEGGDSDESYGVAGGVRVYTSACVAGSTAVADGASMIAHGDVERVVVAAGYLVDADQFALFDAGRALASDGAVRPFSIGRKGLLLGDGVAAVVLESGRALKQEPLAWVRGWGRAGDAYHVCQPRPDGSRMARAIESALLRANIAPIELGYVNAHGSGSAQSDFAESNALRLALGVLGERVPISSTKSLHGQALEASPLVELIATVACMREGMLPPTAGYLGPDVDCPLSVILEPTPARPRYAMSLNSAFGGANTALIVGAP